MYLKINFENLQSESEVAQLCPTLCDPWTVVHQAPLSMGFSRQEYWSGLPCPPLEELPDPGIKPGSPALQAESLSCEPPGTPRIADLWKGEIQGAGHQIDKLSFAPITHANDLFVRRFSSLLFFT